MRLQNRNKKRRIERRQEAAERQAAYDALTLAQKLDRARARGLVWTMRGMILGQDIAPNVTREVQRLLAASERGTADHVLNTGGAR